MNLFAFQQQTLTLRQSGTSEKSPHPRGHTPRFMHHDRGTICKSERSHLAYTDRVTKAASRNSLRWARYDTIAMVLVTTFGTLIRFIRLTIPAGLVFDETYYAKDACLYLRLGQFVCRTEQATEQSYVHPPLGKWLIAIGIKVFGYNEFGWRVAAAVFGSAMIALVYLLARKLFRDRWTATVAGLLVATDFLLVVQSRISMLDIFQTFFVVLGFMFLAFDRERILAVRDNLRLPFPGSPPAREPEWRFATGAAFGLALAVKWSSSWALVGAGLLALGWSWSLIKMMRSKRTFFAEVGITLVGLMIVPTFVYITSYSKYFIDTYSTESGCPYVGPQSNELKGPRKRIDFGVKPGVCKKGAAGTAIAFIDLHERMADYHIHLTAEHAYKSKAITWPIVKRPIAYFYEAEPRSVHILAFGNPAVWWAAIGAAIWLLIRSFRRTKYRPERVIAMAWASQYVPWLAVSRPLFFFYMTPVAPFMMIGLASALSALRDLGKPSRWLVNAYLLIAVGVLLYFFYPVIAAVGLPRELWESRMRFKSWI